MEEARDDESFKENVSSLVRRLRRRASPWVSSLRKHPEATAMVAASLGVALSLLFGSNHFDEKRKRDGTVLPSLGPSRFPSIIEVPPDANGELSDIEDDFDGTADDTSSASALQPDDLDKTWLDKLISLVSNTFGS